MKVEIKKFHELGVQELYDILQLRSEVFVIEQDCVYQDLDGKDELALHVIGYKNKKVVAYTRVFRAGDYFKEASIGRVVVRKSERQFGFGLQIMQASIAVIEQNFGSIRIHISAQKYLTKFYSSLGFKKVGEEYLEDGIPHLAMIKE
ncbi:GNAT family N-acetyltransferase [Arenibacter sp. BSSL-BM3]|uniref:GNAT family N-acetyltransferase n=1 Tax=Arenibacter arenosicollis TaxID=2762274 RepID=A0ABR7QI53_9FLAO|nr:GNAT family N-acetyltransferase [Arenibacter arenosicollis]MBC8766872.1 GNAT family N-acetyltransferase [Arenibacter arenosicollis]